MNKTKFFSSMLVVALFATASVLTSCKDYDDDIKNLQQQIDAKSAKAELESLQSTLQTQLSSVQSSLDTKIANLNTAIANKADASTVTALASSVQDLTATVAALQTQLSSVNSALADYAKTSDVEALNTKYAALTGDISTLKGNVEDLIESETALRKAADENLQQQITALQNLSTALDELKTKVANLEANGYDDTELKNAIAALQTKLADYDALKTDVATLKTDMQNMSEEINKTKSQVNILNVFVNKRLTSMVLMPEFYWEGIEGIEIPSVKAPVFQAKIEDYSFTYNVTGTTAGDNTVKVTMVDNVMGFACTDGKFYCSEKEDTWPTTYFEYYGTVDGKDEYHQAGYPANHSLIDQNGINLIPADKKLVYANISKGGVAKYHINPTTANLEGMTVALFENDAEVYTRAAGAILATPYETTYSATSQANPKNTYKDGVLTIPFKVNNDKLWDMFYAWATTYPSYNAGGMGFWSEPLWGNQWGVKGAGKWPATGYDGTPAKLPFLAAQVSLNDTIVTSDYAVVVPAIYDIVALADNAPEDGVSKGTFAADHAAGYGTVRANHLYESVGYTGCNDADSYGAIPMPATHTVKYNETMKIDFIETHYDYTSYTKYGTSTKDQVMSEELLKQLGLHYEYTLVDYKIGTNATGESVHMAQTDKDGKDTSDKTSPYFTPRKVNADGTQVKGQVPGQEAVDREPLIRVDLVDSEGNIIRYGYVKVRIVRDKAAYEDINVRVEFSDIYMNCGAEIRMTWAQVENLILAELNNKQGITKQDFEQQYYLEVVDPNVEDMPTNANGRLYTTAYGNSRMANRYYYDAEDGKYKQAAGAYDDGLTKMVNDYTADNNWYGRVWYTPHDNSTASHDWDEATNVLVWNLMGDTDINGDYADASNLDRAALKDMIKKLEATYATQGKSAKELSTVVRFVNKNTKASVWVTLAVPAKKVHFAYADINNRVLDHWYSYKEGYKDGVKNDTIEVYANVPTPAEVGRTPLAEDQYTKDLKEYWLNKEIIPQLHDADKFGKFTAAGNIDYKFQFTLPQKGDNVLAGDNTKDETLESDKASWKVKGISGAEYVLYLKDSDADGYMDQIVAKKQGTMAADEVICTLSAAGEIHYNGEFEMPQTTAYNGTCNSAASDILNYIGYYDNAGKNQKDSYLTGQNDKGFTAYVEIKVTSTACYDPIMGNNKFNVRFLRPINVWPATYKFTDAPNDVQFIDLWKLIYIRDWRTYAVVQDNKEQKFGDAAKAGYGEDGKKHKGEFSDTDKNVPYSFYGISNLYVLRDEIRSDAYLPPVQRQALNPATQEAAIKALRSIKEIPALTNGAKQYVKIIAAADATPAYSVDGTTGKANSTSSTDVIAYTNNGGVTKPFHIYVPIAVEYPWGAIGLKAGAYAGWTQTVWAVIDIDPTVGNE